MFDYQKSNKKHDKELNKTMGDKQQVYHRVFDGEDGQKVLDDLKGRCFVKVSTYDPDEKKMGINEGRRSIYVYIKNMMEQDIKEILEGLTK